MSPTEYGPSFLAEPRSDRMPTPLERAEALLQSNPSKSAELGREVLCGAEDSGVSARALLLIGNAEYRQGRLNESVEPLLRARRRFTAQGNEPGVLDTLLVLARVQRDLGQFEAAADQCVTALALSRSLDNREAETDALYLQASVSDAVGDCAAALECLERALEIAREHNLEERQGNILSNIGTLHTDLGDHAHALECLTEAYEVLREVAPDTRSETANLISLGTLYREMGDGDGARKFFERAREISRRSEDRMVEAAALNNLANICRADCAWKSARDLFQEALDLARKLDMRQYEVDNLDGLGQVHAALEEYEQAIDVHFNALEVARRINDREGEIDALLNLGRDYSATGQAGKALEHLHEGLTLSLGIERKHSIYQAHELLSAAYELAGDPVRALSHHRLFYQAEKAVFNEESEQQTRRLAVKFELERARHEADQYRLRVEVSQQAREQAEAEVRERTRELEEAQIEIVTRLAVAAEYRDDDTGEHTRRVGRNAAAIAQAMGLPQDDVDLIFTAARLHDVGKIGISDSVLLKPGTLDADEFELIRSHTTIGARILSGGRSRLLQLAEEIALSHHERWDGKGYPLGLADEAIPVSARIVSVADVLDALTHRRPYKQAWSVSEALAEVERQASRQFDPEVVAACLRVFAPVGGISPLEAAGDWTTVERPRVDLTERRQAQQDIKVLKERFDKILAQRTRELETTRLESENSVRQLEEMAFTDALTGLRNRRAFEADLEVESHRASRSSDRMSVLKIDLDGLKVVNESEGHESGDSLLIAFADAFRSQLREFGRVYRVGGDEFAAILVHVATPDFPRVLEKIDGAVRVVQEKGHPLAGASAGLAEMPEGGSSASELVSLSERRMYRDKLSRVGSAQSAELLRD